MQRCRIVKSRGGSTPVALPAPFLLLPAKAVRRHASLVGSLLLAGPGHRSLPPFLSPAVKGRQQPRPNQLSAQRQADHLVLPHLQATPANPAATTSKRANKNNRECPSAKLPRPKHP